MRNFNKFIIIAYLLPVSVYAVHCNTLLLQLKASAPIEYSHLNPKTLRDAYVWWMTQKDLPAEQPERRLKFSNAPGKGQSEMADPVREILAQGPNGKMTWKVYSSGGRKIEAKNRNALYSGGTKTQSSRKIEDYIIRRADGTKSDIGSYHTGDFSWDMLVVTEDVIDPITGEKKQKQIGYAGMMAKKEDQERPSNFNELPIYTDRTGKNPRKYEMATEIIKGKPTEIFIDQGPTDIQGSPTIADNHTRSRRSFDISYEQDKKGKWHEVWTEKGPVFPGKPTARTTWINGTFRHGYGGRPIIGENGQPWRDEYGYKWIVFETVTDEKAVYQEKAVFIDGKEIKVLEKNLIPYKTEVLARRMKDDYQAFAPEEKMFEELMLSSITSSPKAKELSRLDYYPATVRDYDKNGEPNWFLREGGANLAAIEVEGKKFWVKSESPSNFTQSNYNVILSYRAYEQGPLGPYEDILTPKGDLQKFFSELGELGISWGFARADFTFDESGRFWFRGHGILKNDLPKNYPLSGWPTAQQFTKYFRRQILLPASWTLVNGQPIPHMDPIQLPAEIIEKYLNSKKKVGMPRTSGRL